MPWRRDIGLRDEGKFITSYFLNYSHTIPITHCNRERQRDHKIATTLQDSIFYQLGSASTSPVYGKDEQLNDLRPSKAVSRDLGPSHSSGNSINDADNANEVKANTPLEAKSEMNSSPMGIQSDGDKIPFTGGVWGPNGYTRVDNQHSNTKGASEYEKNSAEEQTSLSHNLFKMPRIINSIFPPHRDDDVATSYYRGGPSFYQNKHSPIDDRSQRLGQVQGQGQGQKQGQGQGQGGTAGGGYGERSVT